MATVETPVAKLGVNRVVDYGVADTAIAELREKFTGLVATTPKGYEEVRTAIATVREIRVGVEKTRVALKEDALKWGKMVDAEAKRLTADLLAIEEPLKTAKQAVDDEKERVRMERENAERLRLEAEAKAKRDAEEAELAKAREIIAEQRRQLEADRLAEEARAKAEAERVAVEQRAERERLAAERLALEEKEAALAVAKQKADREEFERQAKAKVEQEARERVDREKVEAEAKARAEADRAAAEAKRQEELRPDVEKIQEFATTLRLLTLPIVKSKSAKDFVAGIGRDIDLVAGKCGMFGLK